MTPPAPPLSDSQRPRRVVTLGDSLAYGTGDESGRGIAARLEGELAERGVPVRAVNLGINGAQTADLQSRLQQPRVRTQVADADAIVLSIGANDLFRTPAAREKTLKNPFAVAEGILNRLVEIVEELHRVNPTARILILGGYNPVPSHPYGTLINHYLGLWETSVAGAFEDDPLLTVVKLDDLVTPERLSRYDHFHPGAAAYQEAARRIAGMLIEGQPRARRSASG